MDITTERWQDDLGHTHAVCRCGSDCSTHPDAGNPLDNCADCGVATCPDCREYQLNAPVCVECLHGRVLAEAREQLEEARDRVIDRLDGGETLDQAIEAVYADYGDLAFARALKAFTNGETK